VRYNKGLKTAYAPSLYVPLLTADRSRNVYSSYSRCVNLLVTCRLSASSFILFGFVGLFTLLLHVFAIFSFLHIFCLFNELK